MVRWARKRAGMTQSDLAQRAGMPQPSIARIERGTVVPRAATLIALLEATGHELGVEPSLGSDVDREPIRYRLRAAGPQRVQLAMKEMRSRGRPRFDPTRILRRLRRFGVRFVLIGALAEIAQGSSRRLEPVVQVCPAPGQENLERLTTALADLGAAPPTDLQTLTSVETLALSTDVGRLELVARPLPSDGFEELWSNGETMLAVTAVQVRVASVDDLIRIRRRAEGTSEALHLLGAVRDERDPR